MAVDAAAALIAEGGIGNFSARQVAVRIGYTIGTIYNVFGTYDNFLLRVHAKTLDDWHSFLQDRLARRGETEPLHALARGYVDFARTHYNSWAALFEQDRAQDEEVPDWYNSKLKRLLETAETVIMPHVGNDRRKAKRAAQVLWAGIHGLCVLSLSRRLELVGAESLDSLVHALIENYLRGEAGGARAARPAEKAAHRSRK